VSLDNLTVKYLEPGTVPFESAPIPENVREAAAVSGEAVAFWTVTESTRVTTIEWSPDEIDAAMRKLREFADELR